MKHTRLYPLYRTMAVIALAAGIICAPSQTSAAPFRYDAVVQTGSISFSPAQFYAGEPVRIYGTIGNQGTEDIQGHVGFYRGTTMISDPQPFSIKKFGATEEFWVDWTPTEGTYNVAVRVMMTSPVDENTSNNTAISPLMTITERPAPPPPPPVPTPAAPTTTTGSSTGTSSGGATTSGSGTSGTSTGSVTTSAPQSPQAAPAPTPKKPSFLEKILGRTDTLPAEEASTTPQQEVAGTEEMRGVLDPEQEERESRESKKEEQKEKTGDAKKRGGLNMGTAIGAGLIIAGFFLLGALYFTKKSKEAADYDNNNFM